MKSWWLPLMHAGMLQFSYSKSSPLAVSVVFPCIFPGCDSRGFSVECLQYNKGIPWC